MKYGRIIRRIALAALALSLSFAAPAGAQVNRIIRAQGLQLPYTGSQWRTFADRVAERGISVKEFGAKGDGTTNDTTAIANAQAAAASAGKPLVFPPGTYLSDPITIASGGNVPAGVLCTNATIEARAIGTLVTLENVNGAVPQFDMQGCVLDGAGVGTTGLRVHGGQLMHLSDLEVLNFTGNGYEFYGEAGFGIYYSLFERLRAGRAYGQGNGGDGFSITSAAGGNYVNGNTFLQDTSNWNNGNGITLDWSQNTFIGLTSEKNDGDGVAIDNCFSNEFFGGYTEHNNQNYATANASDATTDQSFSLTANSSGVKIIGGRQIGDIVGTTTGQGNVFMPTNKTWAFEYNQNGDATIGRNLTLNAGGGIAGGGSTAIANALNWGTDFSIARAGVGAMVFNATDIRALLPIRVQDTQARLYSGLGTPEGAVAAPSGSLYLRTDGGAGTTLYVKESGTGNTGWIGK